MGYFSRLLKLITTSEEENRRNRILSGLPEELRCNFAVNLFSHKKEIILWFKSKGLNPCIAVDTSRMDIRRFTVSPQLNIRFYIKDCEVATDERLDEGDYDFYYSQDFYEKFINK